MLQLGSDNGVNQVRIIQDRAEAGLESETVQVASPVAQEALPIESAGLNVERVVVVAVLLIILVLMAIRRRWGSDAS